MTGIGLMKKMTLLSKQLEAAFSNYKNQSKSAKREKKRRLTLDGLENNATPRRKSVFASGLKAISKVGGSSVPQAKVEEDFLDEGGVELDASDLMAFLNIERDEAEEMVFLADEDEVEVEVEKKNSDDVDSSGEGETVKCHRSIDRGEFQHLIRTWA